MEQEKLYKTSNPSLLWEVRTNDFHDYEYIVTTPFCSNDSCRVPLDQANLGTDNTRVYKLGWRCSNCGKEYPCPGNDYQGFVDLIQKRYEGHIRQRREIVSLDLLPTKVTDGAEDENYWVKARMGEKNGKLQAVVFFGEKIHGKQCQNDYVQLFLDLEDEQIRFDKTNKNPMRLLGRLTAEFDESVVSQEKKK